jgi:protein arginine kinase
MRASVMMLLPGLAQKGEIKQIAAELKSNGMTIRGAFGEGTSAEGYLYQVSNERTLGLSEQEILEKVSETTMKLCNRELLARDELMQTAETEMTHTSK